MIEIESKSEIEFEVESASELEEKSRLELNAGPRSGSRLTDRAPCTKLGIYKYRSYNVNNDNIKKQPQFQTKAEYPSGRPRGRADGGVA
ncbi:hypothetical protein EVAR_47772_1 [Eumeta japonica]|uniref:Uncharacterized protein n=1 Tax=Eumeta variegata TaxID=151549 RepID=A0A4C1XTG9_EUMVA|nr:hypothetical protein EVAR_47772_1 [Eumeta japonica]